MYFLLLATLIISVNANIIGNSWYSDIESHAYHVAVLRNYEHICSGAVISDQYVLTESECVKGKNLSIRAGSSYNNKDGSVHKVVAKYIKNGLAIAKIAEKSPFLFNRTIHPIQILSSTDTVEVGEWALATGWTSSKLFHKLEAVEMPVASRQSCEVFLDKPIRDDEFCAGYFTGDVEEPTGPETEPGAPLVIRSRLVGIRSASNIVENDQRKPVIFYNIATYQQWIKSKTGI